jgi:hypothetical protein
VTYINTHLKLPDHVDSSSQFVWYKQRPGDITYEYFEPYENVDTPIAKSIHYHFDDQFIDYSNVDYTIVPIVQTYFSPSKQIRHRIETMESKYNLNYDKLCVLFYRGNDKNTETKICPYEEYLHYVKEIVTRDPSIVFLLQSDETEFLEFMTKHVPNSFYFIDETRHVKKCNSTVDLLMPHLNHEFSKHYLAITIIMSKCKYIVCGSGSCSLWIMFYRGHNKNVYQNLDSQWLSTVI